MKIIQFLLVSAILLATGCASLPPARDAETAGFSKVRDKPHYRVGVRYSEAAPTIPAIFRLPEAGIDADAFDAGVTPAQADVVAAHASRSVCQALAPWVQWTATNAGGRVTLRVRRIAASSSGLAATSAALDAVIPGPFRLPAGLGALGIDSRIEDISGTAIVEMQWERGANPLLHRARVSSIGDAWELAPSHARDLRDALRPLALSPQPDAIRQANIAACDARFGKVNAAGRVASMFIPLSPEALDPSDDAPAASTP